LGRRQIARILRIPMATSIGAFVRACMSAKMCFLHYLPPTERRLQAEELAQHYRDAIAQMRRLQRLPLRRAGTGACDLHQEIVCMESEVVWLEAISSWPRHRLAAECPPATLGHPR
jgi:hypothetical protein